MRVRYVKERSSTDVGRRYFQHNPIPIGPIAKFHIEIVPETHRGRCARYRDPRSVDYLVADPILISEKEVIGLSLRKYR